MSDVVHVPDAIGPRPRTREALHAWIAEHLGVRVARSALIAGHGAPFDYLAHAFFADHNPGALGSEPWPLDVVVWANRGGGKTFLGAVATLLDLVFKPGIEVRILAGSLDQSRRMYAHLLNLLAMGGPNALSELVDGRITQQRLRLINGSTLELLAQSHTSVRGTRVQKLRCDEVDLFDPGILEAAQLVTRSKVCGDLRVQGSIECLSTLHVPFGTMHRLVEECRAGRRRLLRWGVVDALEHCPPERVCREDERACPLLPECAGRAKARAPIESGHIAIDDAITLKGRVSSAVWETEMLCLRTRRTDAVLPEFDATKHLFHDDDSVRRDSLLWIAGMDFGIRSPTVVLWAGITPDGCIHIVDERSVADLPLREHLGVMLRGLARTGMDAWPRPSWVAIDPAGCSRDQQSGCSNADLMRAAGFTLRTRVHEVRLGLNGVRARLAPAHGPPTLRIHERCAVLIESLLRYRYDHTRPESLTPVKGEGFDHAIDALRYLIMNHDHPDKTHLSTYAAM